MLECRVIKVDVGDCIKVSTAAWLLLPLIGVIDQHLTLPIKHKPSIVAAQRLEQWLCSNFVEPAATTCCCTCERERETRMIIYRTKNQANYH